MILDDDSIEPTHALCDGRIIPGRNCVRIEKTATVIKLDLPCGRQVQKRMIDLCRDRPRGNRFRESVTPQIAHQAAKRAFPIGEKNSSYGYNHTPVRTLLFYKILIRKIRIAFLSRRTATQYPGIRYRGHEYSDRNFWRYSASRNGSRECIVLSDTAPC